MLPRNSVTPNEIHKPERTMINLMKDAVLEVHEYFSGNTTVEKDYDVDLLSIVVVNDGTSSLTMEVTEVTGTVHTIPVKAGESFDERFRPFRRVKITATTDFRVLVRG